MLHLAYAYSSLTILICRTLRPAPNERSDLTAPRTLTRDIGTFAVSVSSLLFLLLCVLFAWLRCCLLAAGCCSRPVVVARFWHRRSSRVRDCKIACSGDCAIHARILIGTFRSGRSRASPRVLPACERRRNGTYRARRTDKISVVVVSLSLSLSAANVSQVACSCAHSWILQAEAPGPFRARSARSHRSLST